MGPGLPRKDTEKKYISHHLDIYIYLSIGPTWVAYK